MHETRYPYVGLSLSVYPANSKSNKASTINTTNHVKIIGLFLLGKVVMKICFAKNSVSFHLTFNKLNIAVWKIILQ